MSYKQVKRKNKQQNLKKMEPFTGKTRVALDEKLRHSMFKHWNLENFIYTSASLLFQVLLGQQTLSIL